MAEHLFGMPPVEGGAGEPTTTASYTDLVTEIQDAFPDVVSAAKLARIIKNGYTMFLYPPEVIVNGRPISGYKWTWISPGATLNTIVEYSTGTVTVLEGDATVELDGGTWPSWANDDATIIITDGALADHSFTVAERTDALNIELASDWTGAGAVGLAYEIHYHPDIYDLPAAFGGLVGAINVISTESVTTFFPPLLIRSADQVIQYAIAESQAGAPRYASIIPAEFAGATGQRYTIGLWPRPDLNYALAYMYNVNLDAMVAGQYHPGGPQNANTVKACCRAAAELLQSGGALGTHYQLAMQALATSIAHDMDMQERNRGYNGDASEVQYASRPWTSSITVNGIDITI